MQFQLSLLFSAGFPRVKSPCAFDPIDSSQLPCTSPCCGLVGSASSSSPPEQSIIQTTVQHTRPSYGPSLIGQESYHHPNYVFYPADSLSAVSYADEGDDSSGAKLNLGEISGDEGSEYISS